jgi:hypothetical protein
LCPRQDSAFAREALAASASLTSLKIR